jgi:hypothetical protein
MAMAHLHHFCAVLPSQPYVDMRPVFSFETNEDGLVKGTMVVHRESSDERDCLPGI